MPAPRQFAVDSSSTTPQTPRRPARFLPTLRSPGFASASGWAWLLVSPLLLAVLVATASAAGTIREPAVAGLFYPGDAKVLGKTLDGLLEKAPEPRIPRLRALICPHAGYTYSGKTAAFAYQALAGSDIQTVIVLGPSHYASFQGVSVVNAESYRTPLGLVPISEKAKRLTAAPFVLEPKCLVQRPGWWQQTSKTAPDKGQDTPETWEHSVEVQIPFLQKTLKSFRLVSLVVGEADPAQIARALLPVLDDKTIIVASSDLSHYHTYEAAKSLDSRCVKAISDLDIDQMNSQEACGKLPILTVMHLARLKGWKAQVLDSCNSGDVTGEKDRVVGYASVAFSEPAAEAFNPAERQFLLQLARRTITSVTSNGPLPEVTAKDVAPKLTEKRACFVTLTKSGSLRGCIGSLLPQDALYQAVMSNARNAALRDPRFSPVTSDEVSQLKIEISVLTEPKPLAFSSPDDLLNKLHPGQDGIVLRIGSRMATFLPQVWEQIPAKTDFLNRLSEKAGCAPSAWKGEDTTVSVYQVECFEEHP